MDLARQGAKVAIHYNASAEAALQAVREIEADGGTAISVQADLNDAAAAFELVASVAEKLGGRIDILVNNAGGLVDRRPLSEMDWEFVTHVMNLNFTSTVMVTRAALPLIPKGGVILNMASLAARNGGAPGASVYAASKGAIMSFTRGLAKELGPRGIRVNCLCPGLIDTLFHDTFSTDDERYRTREITPLRREGQPQEVGSLAAFLVSDAASFITGASIDVNGGLGFS